MTRMRTIVLAVSTLFFLGGTAAAFEAEIDSLPKFGAGSLSVASPFVTAAVTSDIGALAPTVTATDGTNAFPVTALGSVISTAPAGSVQLFSIDVSSACPGSFVVSFTAQSGTLATSSGSHLVLCQ